MAEKPWAQMTADERRAWRIDQWRNPDIPFDSPEAEAAYKARVDRLLAAYQPGEGRPGTGEPYGRLLAGRMGGADPVRCDVTTPRGPRRPGRTSTWSSRTDSIVGSAFAAVSAQMLEDLDYGSYHWPGHGVAKEASFQYNEKEWMLPEEYDHLISDPTDYMLRVYLPRTVGAFTGFGGLSSFWDFIEMPFCSFHMLGWGSPEMTEGLERLAAASRSAGAWAGSTFGMVGELMSAGFPDRVTAGSKAPFDILGDTMRGTRGVIMDMYRYPDKVLAACERLVRVAIDWALKRPGVLATPIVFLPLHKGADGFMSDEQFRTFYWPTLRAVLLGLIDEGIDPLLVRGGGLQHQARGHHGPAQGKDGLAVRSDRHGSSQGNHRSGGVHPRERAVLAIVCRDA